MSVQVNNKYLGHATAYAYAKTKGYTGTEEEFAALMASYASVAEEAAESAEEAAASAQTATTKAGEASASATAAATAKTAAQTAQSGAETAAQTATTQAGNASDSATTASAKATEAAGSAATASTKATEAATSATNAAGSATTATTKAGEAAASATAAAASAEAAEEAAQTLVIDTTLTQAGQAADAKKVGDEISTVKDGLSDLETSYETAMDGIGGQEDITGGIVAFDPTGKTIEQVSISDTSVSSATITRCGKNIYPKYTSGSANSFSWTVATDGTITFTGTPTADTLLRMQNIRIPLANGDKFALSFANNLYDTNNRLSFFGVTSGGNIQLNLNSENATATWTAASTTVALTELRLRVPKDFNATGLTLKPMLVIGDAPAEFEEYNSQTFSVSVVDGVVQDTITMLDGVNTIWSSVGDITVTCGQNAKIADYVDDKIDTVTDSFYSYEASGTARYLYIYYKSGNNYVRWQLHNVPAPSSNSDTWQIGRICGLDGNFGNLTEIVRGGEFELAFKEHGAADYCGGNNHGDETTDTFKLFIDGMQITDLSVLADGKRHPFSRIDAFEIATVNRCDTPSEDILKHQKIWTFEKGKVKVRQTFKFLAELSVDGMLVCMFAALRSAFKYGIRKGGVSIENMTTSTYEKTYTRSDDIFYEMYGDSVTAKISAKTDNSEDNSVVWINNAEDLNKLYYGYYGLTDASHPTTVPINTIATSESEYDVAYTPTGA